MTAVVSGPSSLVAWGMPAYRARRGTVSLLVAASIAAASQPALGANVLVAGSAPKGFVLGEYLESQTHNVTRLPFDLLPACLATYSTVWVHTANSLAAAWSDGDMVSGKGRIVVVMDSNWITWSSPEDEWVANLQRFLQSPDSDGDGTPDIDDSCTDADGFGDPFHPANTCALDACPDVAGAAPDGCAAAVPGLSAAGRVLLGLIFAALATPAARSAARRSWIGPISTRRAREQRES